MVQYNPIVTTDVKSENNNVYSTITEKIYPSLEMLKEIL